MKLPQCDNSGKASLAQHNNALCHICVGYDKLGAVAQTKHVHLTVPDHDNFRFSESWLSSEAGKIMKEEHRYRFGRRAWALEYKSIHEREVFSKNDPVEFMFVEDVEVQRARALRFGLRDLPSFLNKFSSEDDPEGLREDLDELEFEAECLQAEHGSGINPNDTEDILSTCEHNLRYRPNPATRMGGDMQVRCESSIHSGRPEVAVEHPLAVWKCPTCQLALCAQCNALCHGIIKPSSSTDTKDSNGSAQRPPTRTDVRVKWHEPLEVVVTPHTRFVLPDEHVLRARAVEVEEFHAGGDEEDYELEYYTEEDSTEDEDEGTSSTTDDGGDDSEQPPIVAPYQPPTPAVPDTVPDTAPNTVPNTVPDTDQEEARVRPARPAPPPPAKRGSASTSTPPAAGKPPPPPNKPRHVSTAPPPVTPSPPRAPSAAATSTHAPSATPAPSAVGGQKVGVGGRPPRPTTLPPKPTLAAKPKTLLKMAHTRVVKPAPNRKPTMLRDTNYRPVKRGSTSETTAPVLPPVTPIFAPSAQDPNACRRRTDSESVKLRRLESAASVSDAAAAIMLKGALYNEIQQQNAPLSQAHVTTTARARFKLKAMKARLTTREETDEARIILQEMQEEQQTKKNHQRSMPPE